MVWLIGRIMINPSAPALRSAAVDQAKMPGPKVMGGSTSRPPIRDGQRIPREFERLSWTESLTSAASSSVGEFPEFRRKGDSLASAYTCERLTDDPESPVVFLSLAYEELTHVSVTDIPEVVLNSVKAIDLSNNRLSRDLQFLADFESVTSINLDRNRLECLTAFPRLPRLRSLSINYNRILAINPFVASLAMQCPNLVFLSMMGNEVCPNYLNGGTEQQNELYRLSVISHFPSLRYLDDSPVTSQEREMSLTFPSTSQTGQSPLGSIDEGIDTE